MPELKTVSRAVAVGDFVELDAGTDVTGSPRYNEDIAPTRASQRTWNHWHIAALWIGMSICVPTYTLGGVLTAYFGLSVVEALWTILIANVVILIPLTLNAFPGTKYGIPFPVLLRSSFGIIGSNVPALIRALIACGWFGIQTMFGGIAVHLMFSAISDSWAALGGKGEVAGFFIFWLANVWVVIRGSESIKMPRSIRGADADGGWRRPHRLGLAAGFGERTDRAAAEPASRHAFPGLFFRRPHRDGRFLGDALAQYPGLQPLRSIAEEPDCRPGRSGSR